MMVVTFLKPYTPYVKGDTASIKKEDYEKLVEAGIVSNDGRPHTITASVPLENVNLKEEPLLKGKVDVVIPTKDAKKLKKKIKTK
jgi:hypothetical protein